MSSLSRRLCLRATSLVFLLLSSFAVTAAPQVVTISGDPLTVYVGDEQSFQIINSAVPGTGQFFPPTTGQEGSPAFTADAGWFVFDNDTLYSPDFDHHPAGTATDSIGVHTPFTSVSISPVTGSGTASSPFQVTVVSDLGGSGLRATQQYSYVNGNNYVSRVFTIRNNGNATQTVKVFDAGDIYLAGDDDGLPYREPVSGSPGGRGGAVCGNGNTDYFILLIPQTPADAFSANGYDNIWGQIGDPARQLDSAVLVPTGGGCVDNGAALQWNRSIAAGATVTLLAATSFGDIPAITQFNVTDVTPASGQQGQTVNVTISGVGFQLGGQSGSTSFNFGAGITVSNVVIVNSTMATATLSIAASAALGSRDVIGTQNSSEGAPMATDAGGFTVTAAGVPVPGTLQFGSASLSVNEGSGTVTVTVTRTGGSDGAAAVNYATADGSAVAPGDYTATSGALNWSSGDASSKSFTVAIIDDTLVEGNEQFSVSLSQASGAALGSAATATVTIVDNDSGPQGTVKVKTGGALGAPVLFALGLLGALRRRAALLRATALSLLCAGLTLAAPARAASVADNLYVGVRGGELSLDIDSGRLSRALSQRGFAVDAGVDSSAFAGTFYLGYELAPHADVEVAYSRRITETTATLTGALPADVGPLLRAAADEIRGYGDIYSAAVRLRGEILPRLSLNPRVGVFVWDSRVRASNGTEHFATTHSGGGITLGVNLAFRIWRGLEIGGGVDYYHGEPDNDATLYAGTIEWRFGR